MQKLFFLVIGILCAQLPAIAAAADYGVLKKARPLSNASWEIAWGEAWTKTYPDGSSAWSRKVKGLLLKRGFSDKQALIYSSIRTNGARNGKLRFRWVELPINVNTETGQILPLDPVGYAQNIPQCAAIDEKNCKLRYGAFVAKKVFEKKGQYFADMRKNVVCKLTQKQRNYCRSKEYKLTALGLPFGCFRAGLGTYEGCAGLVSFEPEGKKAKSKLAFSAGKNIAGQKRSAGKAKKAIRKSGIGAGYCPPIDYVSSCSAPQNAANLPEYIRGPFTAAQVSRW